MNIQSLKYGLLLFMIAGFCCISFLSKGKTGDNPKELQIPLADASQLTIEGPHRFIEIAGIKGLHVSSLKTKAFVETQSMNNEKGTFSVWMSPLEDFNKSPGAGKLPNSMTYPLVSDYWPSRMADSSHFSVYYQGSHYPRVIARFTSGGFWSQMDFGLAPFVYAEELPLKKGQWYHFAVTWDKASGILIMYINGQLVGHNYSAKSFNPGRGKLYIGNPLMIVSNLAILPGVLNHEDIKKEYFSLRPATNGLSDNTIKKISSIGEMPESPIILDDSWEKVYECTFTDPSELADWTFQTGDLYRDRFKLEVTREGLYWETPDIIHTESRAYLWSPFNIEGDQWIEFEFKVLSPKGLALLILCASGMQGEDIIEDHGLRNTGAMGDMLSNYRNYHWEYMRRVEAMRTDVETQYVNKNPWGKSMYVGCVPRFDRNRWYKIGIVKTDNRLIGLLDGKTVFDITDNPYDNNGPVFNSGRFVLRQMYHTTMMYRNVVIYKKDRM